MQIYSYFGWRTALQMHKNCLLNCTSKCTQSPLKWNFKKKRVRISIMHWSCTKKCTHPEPDDEKHLTAYKFIIFIWCWHWIHRNLAMVKMVVWCYVLVTKIITILINLSMVQLIVSWLMRSCNTNKKYFLLESDILAMFLVAPWLRWQFFYVSDAKFVIEIASTTAKKRHQHQKASPTSSTWELTSPRKMINE